jgi:hypothetical protein
MTSPITTAASAIAMKTAKRAMTIGSIYRVSSIGAKLTRGQPTTTDVMSLRTTCDEPPGSIVTP